MLSPHYRLQSPQIFTFAQPYRHLLPSVSIKSNPTGVSMQVMSVATERRRECALVIVRINRWG